MDRLLRPLTLGALSLFVLALAGQQVDVQREASARLVSIAPAPPPPAVPVRATHRPPTRSVATEVVLRVAPLPPAAPPKPHMPPSAEPPPYPLLVPVAGVSPDDLYDSYAEPRSGDRVHRALDILAPTGTPVLAAADGVIVRTHTSRLGGLTVYQADAARGYIYYYAHLDRYAEGLKAGQTVAAGDTLGTVGMTGNAPVPHLHFAIWKVRPGAERLWGGRPVNPYPLLAW